MDYRIALKDMFPGCVLFGSMAEMENYAGPQNCEIVAQGLHVRDIQEGRKSEDYLVEYKGTLMFLSTADKYLAQGVTKAHASLSRMEGHGISREDLTKWALGHIEWNCTEPKPFSRGGLPAATRRQSEGNVAGS